MFDHLRAGFLGLMAALGLAQPDNVFQGYIEGEYVLVAPQVAGTIDVLSVARGDHVKKGDPLYTLEHVSEQAALDQAKAQTQHDAAALDIAQINYTRDQMQIATQAISQAAVDTDRATLDQAKAQVDAAMAAEAQAQWRLDQKTLTAPSDAFVFDTLERVGEYIPVGQAVVSLLPASNIRARFFVPGTVVPKLMIGGTVKMEETGFDVPIAAHITYISSQAEYSPPELYNRDNREKLLFMIEATPDAEPERLHPGLPVDVAVDMP
jgi:HlyD family secretion protein